MWFHPYLEDYFSSSWGAKDNSLLSSIFNTLNIHTHTHTHTPKHIALIKMVKMDKAMLKKLNFRRPFDRPHMEDALNWDNVSSVEKIYLVEKQNDLKSDMTIEDFLFWWVT